MGLFVKVEFDASMISSTIELTRVQVLDIMHFVVEIQRFVCDHAKPPIIEKLRSKGVAMHVYGVSAYYPTVTQKSIKWTWAEPFEMNVNIEKKLNFVVDNDRLLFLDAQEAKKVSERTVDR